MKRIISMWLTILLSVSTIYASGELGGLVDRTTGKGVYDARTVFPTYPVVSNMVSKWTTYPATTNINMNGLGVTNFTFLASQTSVANTNYGFAFGVSNNSSGAYSLSTGYKTTSSGSASTAHGANTLASGNTSYAEGYNTKAFGVISHAEGSGTIASNTAAHSEGTSTIASGQSSHAEGFDTIASGINSHSEGTNTTANGIASHSAGANIIVNGANSYGWSDGTPYTNNTSSNFTVVANNGLSLIGSEIISSNLSVDGSETILGNLSIDGSVTATNDGRSVWGNGLSINDISTNSPGASQHGLKFSSGGRFYAQIATRVITNSSGAVQFGDTISHDIRGNGNATMIISDSTGAGQFGYAGYGGAMVIESNSYGAVQHIFAQGSSVISSNAYGAAQFGQTLWGASAQGSAQNFGVGAIQLFQLAGAGMYDPPNSEQKALTTVGGAGSLLMGAGIASNRYSIVAGDGQVSHGDGSITAGGGFYGDGFNITDLDAENIYYATVIGSNSFITTSNLIVSGTLDPDASGVYAYTNVSFYGFTNVYVNTLKTNWMIFTSAQPTTFINDLITGKNWYRSGGDIGSYSPGSGNVTGTPVTVFQLVATNWVPIIQWTKLISGNTLTITNGIFDSVVSRLGNFNTANSTNGFFKNGVQATLSDGSVLPTSDWNFNFHKITSLINPINPNDAANKYYVDNLVNGLSWQDHVLTITNNPPISVSLGDRYLVWTNPTAAFINYTNYFAIVTNVSPIGWEFIPPQNGWATFAQDTGISYVYNASNNVWTRFSAVTTWGSISGALSNQVDLWSYLSWVGLESNNIALLNTNNIFTGSTNTFSSISLNSTVSATNDGRSVWGNGVSINNIASDAYGASQNGNKEYGTMAIGTGAYGANQSLWQASILGATSTIGNYSSGAEQKGLNSNGSLIIANSCFGAGQYGMVGGTMTIDAFSYGSSQHGMTDNPNGSWYIGQSCYGASQWGGNRSPGSWVIDGYAHGASQWGGFQGVATNLGVGAMQLLNLSGGQRALTTSGGGPSLLIGAGTASNKNVIVTGDGQVSHGDGSITAGGGFWSSYHSCPTSSNAYDLGSLLLPWRDLYIGSNSIYMGGVKVLSMSNGTLVANNGISGVDATSVMYPIVTSNGVVSTNLNVSSGSDPDVSGTYTYWGIYGGTTAVWVRQPLVGGNQDRMVTWDINTFGIAMLVTGNPPFGGAPAWLLNPAVTPEGTYSAYDSSTGSVTVAFGDVVTAWTYTTNWYTLGSASTNMATDFAQAIGTAYLASNNAFGSPNSFASTISVTNDGRSVWGSKLSTSNIHPNAFGASQHGQVGTGGTMILGDGSIGADQRGFSGVGGGGPGRMAMNTSCAGAVQHGYNLGDMYMGAQSYGSIQAGINFGNVTNSGAAGAIQLFNFQSSYGSQTSIVTSAGSASIVLGAGTASNKNSIVAGDGTMSHGDGSITAGGGLYGSAQGLTNFATSFNPYIIPYAISNMISPSNGTYQYYEPTGISTMYFPTAYATNLAWGFVVDIKVNTNVYAFTFFTNNVCFGTNDYPGNGVSAFLATIRTNDVSTLTIYKAYNSINWRVQ